MSGSRRRARVGGDDAQREGQRLRRGSDQTDSPGELRTNIDSLPEDILLRIILSSLEAEMGEPVMDMYNTAIPRDPVERLSQLASVSHDWNAVVTQGDDRVWASITHAIFHVRPRDPLPDGRPEGLWKGPLTLQPTQRVWYRGTRSAVVTLAGLDPSHPPDPSDHNQYYTLRLADEDVPRDTVAIHVKPKSPWRVICLALVGGARSLSLSNQAAANTGVNPPTLTQGESSLSHHDPFFSLHASYFYLRKISND